MHHSCLTTADTYDHPHSFSRGHGLRLRSYPRGELSSGTHAPRREHASADIEQLQRRDPGCVQGDIEQPVGSTARRLPGHSQEAGAWLVSARDHGCFLIEACTGRAIHRHGEQAVRPTEQDSFGWRLQPHKPRTQSLGAVWRYCSLVIRLCRER